MKHETLNPNCRTSNDGINWKTPTIQEVFESGEAVKNELVRELAMVRNAVADELENQGVDAFNFGLDWAMGDPTSVADFVKKVLENFELKPRVK
jgi:hypothetical protein